MLPLSVAFVLGLMNWWLRAHFSDAASRDRGAIARMMRSIPADMIQSRDIAGVDQTQHTRQEVIEIPGAARVQQQHVIIVVRPVLQIRRGRNGIDLMPDHQRSPIGWQPLEKRSTGPIEKRYV